MNSIIIWITLITMILIPFGPTLENYGITSIGFIDNSRLITEMGYLSSKLSEITGINRFDVIPKVFGDNLTITYTYRDNSIDSYSCWSTLNCYGSISPLDDPNSYGLFIHEFGHRFLDSLGLSYNDLDMELGYYDSDNQYIHVAGINPETNRFERTNSGYPEGGQPYEQHGNLSPNYNTYQEDFADMFMNWVLGQFTDNQAGQLRNKWMTNFITDHIELVIMNNGLETLSEHVFNPNGTPCIKDKLGVYLTRARGMRYIIYYVINI